MSTAVDLRSALDPVYLFRRAYGVEPLPWQVDYLAERRNVAIVKGRQVGASTASAIVALHSALYHADTNSVVVSPSQKQSVEIANKVRVALKALGINPVQDSAALIKLRNGSRVVSLPGSPKSVRGWTARVLILDEAAFIEPQTWTAARALVAATAGRVIALSTPAAEVGDFYELASGSDDGWARFTIRSDEVSTITPEFLAAERAAMSPDAYAQEFEATFGKGGSSLFTRERIDALFPEESAA